VLRLSRDTPLPNVSRTLYTRTGDHMELQRFADTSALDQAEVETTHEPGDSVDARG
jgi:hypothetical protein